MQALFFFFFKGCKDFQVTQTQNKVFLFGSKQKVSGIPRANVVWFGFNCMGNLKKKICLFNPSQSFPSFFWFSQRAIIYPHTSRKQYAKSKVASYRKQIRLKNRGFQKLWPSCSLPAGFTSSTEFASAAHELLNSCWMRLPRSISAAALTCGCVRKRGVRRSGDMKARLQI